MQITIQLKNKKSKSLNTEKAIIIVDNTVTYGEHVDYTYALSVLNSVMLDVLRKTAKRFPTMKETLYDEFNMAASKVLEEFIPDKELRPDLTAEALRELEDDFLNKNF